MSAYAARDVWLIEVHGDYAALAAEVDHAVQLALAECPRGVVVALDRDLSEVGEPCLDTLASAGRHVRPWPRTPVVLATPDRAAAALLRGRPGAASLGHASSLVEGWTQLMGSQPTPSARVRLHAGALAARSARQFFTRTCLDWGLTQHLASGPLVVSELVTNALEHSHSDIDVVLARDGLALRVGVRDQSPDAPVTREPGACDVGGRGLQVIQALAQAVGALPTRDGGKLVWAVLRP